MRVVQEQPTEHPHEPLDVLLRRPAAFGGIAWRLSATPGRGVDGDGGRVVPGNFDEYPILRFDEMPAIEGTSSTRRRILRASGRWA